MRWFWIDRFVEFVSGQQAVAIKNVTLAEEHVLGHYPGYPTFPSALILEGMAQTGGMLVGEMLQFQMRLVLAKVSRLAYHFEAQPGDRLRYTARIVNQNSAGARISATSHVEEALQASAEFFLAVLPPKTAGESLFNPTDFARLLRMLRVYEVGRDPSGAMLRMPAEIADAELGRPPDRDEPTESQPRVSRS